MIVLASKSPRRQELIRRITSDFIVDSADIDEETSYIYSPIEATKDISKRKALAVFKNHPNDIVIGADTIVVLNNKIYGKPKDEKNAERILKELSGKTHQVITGYTIVNKDHIVIKHVISDVTFYDLSKELIDAYIKSKIPMDKAGAYGVQNNDQFKVVKEIKGSLDNVIGFPVDEIRNSLKLFK